MKFISLGALAIVFTLFASAQNEDPCVEEYLNCLEDTGLQWQCGIAFENCNDAASGDRTHVNSKATSVVCSNWTKVRDNPETLEGYEKASSKIKHSIKIQQLWLSRLNELEAENFEANLIIISALDVFITVFDVTAQTVGSTLDLATLGAGSKAITYTSETYHALRDAWSAGGSALSLSQSESLEEAMVRHVADEVSLVSYVASLVTVIDALIAAKDRSEDRFAALETVRFAKETAERELNSVSARLDKEQRGFEQRTRFKNRLDDLCNG